MSKGKSAAAVSLGRLGGLARGKLIRAGKVSHSGFAVPKPTECPVCGKEQPSVGAAKVHCPKPEKT